MLFELRGLLSAEVAADIVRELAEAPFSDGKTSAHGEARERKNNLQLEATHPTAKRLGGIVLAALAKNESFKAAALPHTILPLLFARYLEGMAYGDHLDLPVMGTGGGPLRTDLSITVWLSPRASYDGGELLIQRDGGETAFKADAGDATVYPSATLHRVAPVTRGERVVAVSWIQSLVRDLEQRTILYTLFDTLTALQRRGDREAEVNRLRQLHYRLMRMWAEC